MKAPCKDCPDRTLTCHDTCSKYKELAEWNRGKMAAHSAEMRASQEADFRMNAAQPGKWRRRRK